MPVKKKQSRKKSGATRNTEQKPSASKYLLIIVLIVPFAAFLFYLDNIPVKGDKSSTKNSKETSNHVPKNSADKKEKYKFVFYTELPDREVETYEIEEEPLVKQPVAKKKMIAEKPLVSSKPAVSKKYIPPAKPVVVKSSVSKKSQSNTLYQLQVGAFSDWSKADAMKGRLALLGVEPNIQMFSVNGQKMYRVRIGPSSDEKKIERIKSQLKAHNINTFIQKIRG
ncbi:MAG: SPOR domain-containing protein [gamma proteobacterium symbiont of Taylorina sp.]|nr:SPOR domain-containing protein [gamma proteobacterium symbiont of Taylorina sp.]